MYRSEFIYNTPFLPAQQQINLPSKKKQIAADSDAAFTRTSDGVGSHNPYFSVFMYVMLECGSTVDAKKKLFCILLLGEFKQHGDSTKEKTHMFTFVVQDFLRL